MIRKFPHLIMVFWVYEGQRNVLGACKIHMQKGKQLQILDTIIIKATDTLISTNSSVAVSVIK
jgi:hypothetical protein